MTTLCYRLVIIDFKIHLLDTALESGVHLYIPEVYFSIVSTVCSLNYIFVCFCRDVKDNILLLIIGSIIPSKYSPVSWKKDNWSPIFILRSKRIELTNIYTLQENIWICAQGMQWNFMNYYKKMKYLNKQS